MNTTAQWFKAADLIGECVDIRYARKSPTSNEPEWLTVSHYDCDGIGGFAQLLRESGADITELPKTNFPNKKILSPLLSLLNKYKPNAEIALRDDWNLSSDKEKKTNTTQSLQSPPALAWHIFNESETEQIRNYCRSQKITVNSHLLKCLDQSVRPDTKRPDFAITWMIPVNMRGDVSYEHDTENHVSCVDAIISDGDSPQAIQQQITQRLKRGEHRLNHLTLALTKFIPLKLKSFLLTKARSSSKGNIGAFSNLGVWDSQKTIDTTDSWLFCPPVCNGQLLAAGCVTFQKKLGLAIQTHPDIADSMNHSKKWLEKWQNLIINDLG